MPKKRLPKTERNMRSGMKNADAWGDVARRTQNPKKDMGAAKLAATYRRAVRDDLSNSMPKPKGVSGNPNLFPAKRTIKLEKKKPFKKINAK